MNRIRSLREDKDLRQIDVALAVGIDQRSLSNYETEKTQPDAGAIIKLAKFFNVSCDYLLGVTDTDLRTPREIIAEIDGIKDSLSQIQRALNKM